MYDLFLTTEPSFFSEGAALVLYYFFIQTNQF